MFARGLKGSIPGSFHSEAETGESSARGKRIVWMNFQFRNLSLEARKILRKWIRIVQVGVGPDGACVHIAEYPQHSHILQAQLCKVPQISGQFLAAVFVLWVREAAPCESLPQLRCILLVRRLHCLRDKDFHSRLEPGLINEGIDLLAQRL